MQEKKGIRWRGRLAAWTLAVALTLSLCAGCGHHGKIDGVTNDDTDTDGADAAEASVLDWESVITGAEIHALNVVFVIDASASTLRNDPDRNWQEAACMFLDTLYASASQSESIRLAGSKGVQADVILYNDTVTIFKEYMFNLGTEVTVSGLKNFIRSADNRGGDSALAEALNSAVDILSNNSKGGASLFERSLIILFTDGYTPKEVPQSVTPPSGGEFPGAPDFDAVPGASSADGNESAASSYVFTSADAVSEAPDVDAASGATSASGSGSAASSYASSGTVSMPDFGEDNPAQLERALKRAKELNYAIYVLMSNLQNNPGGDWEQFKAIAEYTKRNLMGELMKVLYSHWDLFEGMSINDFTWPRGYELSKPVFLDDPLAGGGVFPNPDGGDEKVNYLTATSPTGLMDFYTTLAANTLAGSSAAVCVPVMDKIHETINKNGETEHVWMDSYRYDIQVPDSGISALMCFCFSNEKIGAVHTTGPDPNNPGQRKDYTSDLRNREDAEWVSVGNMTMRNVWYDNLNISTLIIINPEPGLWNIYARGKNGNNRSLRAYATLVSGAKVDISFAQGNDAEKGSHPATGGDFQVLVSELENRDDTKGVPLPEEFYETLKTKCDITRIPPWLSISGKEEDPKALQEDIAALMKDFPAWLERTLSDFKKPETLLTQMSGGEIDFQPGTDDDGNPVLTAHFDAPLPGLYYVTLNMTAGEGASKIDYSKSFWVRYEPKTDYTVYCKTNRDTSFQPEFPDAWGKISNADVPDPEDLELNIDMTSVKITPSDLGTVKPDSRNPDAFVIHGSQKGEGTLSVDVSTKYGDKWTLVYNIVVL